MHMQQTPVVTTNYVNQRDLDIFKLTLPQCIQPIIDAGFTSIEFLKEIRSPAHLTPMGILYDHVFKIWNALPRTSIVHIWNALPRIKDTHLCLLSNLTIHKYIAHPNTTNTTESELQTMNRTQLIQCIQSNNSMLSVILCIY